MVRAWGRACRIVIWELGGGTGSGLSFWELGCGSWSGLIFGKLDGLKYWDRTVILGYWLVVNGQDCQLETGGW